MKNNNSLKMLNIVNVFCHGIHIHKERSAYIPINMYCKCFLCAIKCLSHLSIGPVYIRFKGGFVFFHFYGENKKLPHMVVLV